MSVPGVRGPCAPEGAPAAAHGFTLVELLIALIVLSAVGMTVSSAVGNVSSQAYLLERRAVAHWVAQNQLARLRLEARAATAAARTSAGAGGGLATGRDSQRVFMSRRDWEVVIEVSGTDHPALNRVELDVFELVRGDRVGPLEHVVAFVGQH